MAEATKKAAKPDEATLQRQAYDKATSILRTKHQKDFNEIRAAEAEKLGVKWAPKPTAEEKAAEQLADLLEKFPHLRDEIVRDEPVATDVTASQDYQPGE